MTPGAPCDVNEISYVKRIDHEINLSWQAQYLVKFKRHFSWQRGEIWNDAGARNAKFFNRKC